MALATTLIEYVTDTDALDYETPSVAWGNSVAGLIFYSCRQGSGNPTNVTPIGGWSNWALVASAPSGTVAGWAIYLGTGTKTDEPIEVPYNNFKLSFYAIVLGLTECDTDPAEIFNVGEISSGSGLSGGISISASGGGETFPPIPTQTYSTGTLNTTMSTAYGTIDVNIRYPTGSGSSRAFPLIINAHGAGTPTFPVSGTQVNNYHSFIAPQGYVLAAPSMGSNMFSQNTSGRGNDLMSATIDRLFELNTTVGSPLFGKIDTTRVGYIGTSMGSIIGYKFFDNTYHDDRIACFFMKAGCASCFGIGGHDFADNTTPILHLHGDADNTVPFSEGLEAYNLHQGQKGFIEVDGMGHDVVTSSAILVDAPLGFFRRYLYGQNSGLTAITTATNSESTAHYQNTYQNAGSGGGGTIPSASRLLGFLNANAGIGFDAVTGWTELAEPNTLTPIINGVVVTRTGGSVTSYTGTWGSSTGWSGVMLEMQHVASASVQSIGGTTFAISTLLTPGAISKASGTPSRFDVRGTWIIQQDYGNTYQSAINFAFNNFPNVLGFSWRFLAETACDPVTGNLITTSGGRLHQAVVWVRNYNTVNGTNYKVALRPMFGGHQPAAWKNAMPANLKWSYTEGQTTITDAPHPCFRTVTTHSHDGLPSHTHQAGEINDIFLIRFRTFWQQLVTYAQANPEVTFLHGGWWGGDYSEVGFWPPVQYTHSTGNRTNGSNSTIIYTGYTDNQWADAMLALMNIVYEETPSQYPVEWGASGRGPYFSANPNMIVKMRQRAVTLYGGIGSGGDHAVYLSMNGWHNTRVMGDTIGGAENTKQEQVLGVGAYNTTDANRVRVELQHIISSPSYLADDWILNYQWAYGNTVATLPNRRTLKASDGSLMSGPIEVYLTQAGGNLTLEYTQWHDELLVATNGYHAALSSGPQMGGSTYSINATLVPGGLFINGEANISGSTFSQTLSLVIGAINPAGITNINGTTFTRNLSLVPGAMIKGTSNISGATFIKALTMTSGTLTFTSSAPIASTIYNMNSNLIPGTISRTGPIPVSGSIFSGILSLIPGNISPSGIKNVSGTTFTTNLALLTGSINQSGQATVGGQTFVSTIALRPKGSRYGQYPYSEGVYETQPGVMIYAMGSALIEPQNDYSMATLMLPGSISGAGTKNINGFTLTAVSLFVPGTIQITGVAPLGASTFTTISSSVFGSISINGTAPIGTSTFTQTASLIPGAVTISGEAPIGGSTFSGSWFLVGGDFNADGNYIINGDTFEIALDQVVGDISIEGSASLSGSTYDIEMASDYGAINPSGSIEIDASGGWDSSLEFLSIGDIAIAGIAGIAGTDFDITSSLEVGELAISSAAPLGSTEYTVTSDLIAGSLLGSGTTELEESTFATIASFVFGTISTTGAAIISGVNFVIGSLQVPGSLTASGELLISDSVFTTTTEFITGAISGSGEAPIEGDIFESEWAMIGGIIDVTGSALISGTEYETEVSISTGDITGSGEVVINGSVLDSSLISDFGILSAVGEIGIDGSDFDVIAILIPGDFVAIGAVGIDGIEDDTFVSLIPGEIETLGITYIGAADFNIVGIIESGDLLPEGPQFLNGTESDLTLTFVGGTIIRTFITPPFGFSEYSVSVRIESNAETSITIVSGPNFTSE